MASSDEAPNSELGIVVHRETLEKAKESLEKESMAVQVEKSIDEGEKEQSLPRNGDSMNGRGVDSSCLEGDDTEKTLARADELFEKGSKALENRDILDAVDCLCRALKIRIAHYGELATECVTSYSQYGCALLYKAKVEADPWSYYPKSYPRNPEKDVIAMVGDVSGSSKASAREVKEGFGDKDQEDDNKGSEGDKEDLAKGDKDDSDLDLALKMLNAARTIVEKHPEDTMEKVHILAALGKASLEREDFKTSLRDYLQALSVLEKLVEPDNFQLAELNYSISFVLVIGSRIKEAIPYLQKGVSVCKSCLRRLRENLSKLNSSNPSTLEMEKDTLEKEKELEAASELLIMLEVVQELMSDPSI